MLRSIPLLCFALALPAVWGQTATITGRVLDSAEAVIPVATVTATNLGTGIDRSATSNSQGIYNIPLLLPGEYRITVKASGFKTLTRTIQLEVAQTASLDVKLEVGDLAQSVEVSAQSVLLDSSTSELGQHVEGKQVLDLPILGRNAYALVQLVPGARMPVQFNTLPISMFTDQFVSINGARGSQNEYLLDGAPNTNPGQSGPTIFPSADSVAEFKVITNAYSAEYGRAAGGVFNVATRAGSNQLHGTLYDFLRNDAITANDFFLNRAGAGKPEFLFNQFGFTAGGPVVLPKVYRGRNRTFFLRQLRRRSPDTRRQLHRDRSHARAASRRLQPDPHRLQRAGCHLRSAHHPARSQWIFARRLSGQYHPGEPHRSGSA